MRCMPHRFMSAVPYIRAIPVTLLTMLIHAHAGRNTNTLKSSDGNIIVRFMSEIGIIIIFKTYYERNSAMIQLS